MTTQTFAEHNILSSTESGKQMTKFYGGKFYGKFYGGSASGYGVSIGDQNCQQRLLKTFGQKS